MKKYCIGVSILFLAINLQAQEKEAFISIDPTGAVFPWSHLNFRNDPENFQFAIVADRTGGHRPGVFEEAVKKLNLLNPEFVMSVGDLIEGYTRDTAEIMRQWDEFNGFISELGMPFFYVPGNHDYINDVMAEIWKQKYGPSYYHFRYRDVLFLCMNSEEATKGSNLGGIERPQFEYFKKVLSENRDVRWTLAFMHQPLWILDNTRYWNELEKLLAERKHTVIAGHHHHYVKYERNNGNYIMLATTGGISSLRGTSYGEFDHLVWVTMTSEGPVLANLMLNGIWDENIVTDRIASMVASEPFKPDPLFLKEEMFSGASLPYRIVNNEKVPMEYEILVHYPETFTGNAKSLQGVVPPNNVITGSLDLSASVPVYSAASGSVRFESRFTWEVENSRKIEAKKVLVLAPVFPAAIAQTPEKIKIDGRDRDWKDLPFTAGAGQIKTGDMASYMGNSDLSFQFGITYDHEYLYLGVRVKDDELYSDNRKSLFDQDGIRIYLDARPTTLSAWNREENLFKDFLGIYMSSSPGNPQVYQKDELPEGTVYAASQQEGVHFYEVAVPMKWITQQGNGKSRNLRLNICAIDVDNEGSSMRLWWQPEWRSENSILGSGTMVLSDK